MQNFDTNTVIKRIENIANKVYRSNKNAVCMLINDLEEFFEVKNTFDSVDKMTTDEFNSYISKIRD